MQARIVVAAAAAASLALAAPASAQKPPSPVEVMNTPAQPVPTQPVGTTPVSILASGNTVQVDSTAMSPLFTQPVVEYFSGSARVSDIPAEDFRCEAAPIAIGDVVRLDTAVVSVSSPVPTPKAWVAVTTKTDLDSFAAYISVPLSAGPGSSRRGGQLPLGIVVTPNAIVDAAVGDVIAVEICVQSDPTSVATARALFQGVHVD